ncbi:MAG: hypothetical protein IT185_02310 [Acidobacteria bacterium]|nr:hypothetical protein [Acidobacteriota bacterium]
MVTRTRSLWGRLLAALLLTLSGPTLFAGGQPHPTGAELVAKHVAAIGGAEAWAKVMSMRATGTIEMAAQGITGTVEMLTARPTSAILRVEVAGLGKIETGYNGTVAWSIDPMVGPALVTGEQLVDMKNDSHFDAMLHPASLVASTLTIGQVEFDGRQAWKLMVKFVEGPSRDEYYDVETGLLLGYEGMSVTDMGKMPVRQVARDYKVFGSIRQPTRLIQSSMGLEQVVTIRDVEFNSVDPKAFDVPAVIKAIMREPVVEDAPWRAPMLASFDDAWVTIRDTFFDPTFGGLDWDQVKATLRPRVQRASSSDEAREVLREMVGALKRSHFSIMSTSRSGDEPVVAGNARVPIDVRLVGDEVVITRVEPGSTAAAAGLRLGDVVLAVDAGQASDWMLPRGIADPRARAMDVWRRAQARLHGSDGSQAVVRVATETGEKRVSVRRVRQPGEVVTMGNLPPMPVAVHEQGVETPSGRRVGVIGFNVWLAQANGPIAQAVDRHRGAAGLVLDLRGNPGGLAAMIRGVAGHLFTEPVVLGRMKMREAELAFPVNPQRVLPNGTPVTPFAGPVAVLVDALTASASECFAGGLQSVGRVRVFGEPSLGQALPASTRTLPNGDILMHVVGDFVTATGQRLEGQGVIPDQLVPLTREALRSGKDPVLQAALEWLDRG